MPRFGKRFNERMRFSTQRSPETCFACQETIGNRNAVEIKSKGAERVQKLCADCSGIFIWIVCRKKNRFEAFDWIVSMIRRFGVFNPDVYETFKEVSGFEKKEDAQAWARDLIPAIRSDDPEGEALGKLSKSTLNFLNSSRGSPWKDSDPLPVKPPEE